MGTGGTKDYTPDEFDRERDHLAAVWTASVDSEKGAVLFEFPSSQLDRGVHLFSQMLRFPLFDYKRLEVEKGNIREEVLRENDSPGTVATNVYKRLLFPDSFRGWKYNLKVIRNISRNELKAWHENFFRPNNTMIAVTGDFKREELIAKLEAKLGDWKKAEVDFSGYQKYEKKFKPGVYYVDINTSQSNIRIGHPGVTRDNPDRYALEVFNRIFGEGFNSILNEKIRSNEGLAYSAGGGFNLDTRGYGAFTMGCATKPETTVRATKMMIDLMKQMMDEKVSEERLNLAKNYLINSFLYEFEDPAMINGSLLSLEYKNLPSDYYLTYRDNISKVTAEDVQRAAKTYLHPDQLTVVIVGNVKKFDKPLTELGKVKEIKLEEESK
jgi:predicted Zn-dependent peptidase